MSGEPPTGLPFDPGPVILASLAVRWPLVLDHAKPGGYPSIAEQAVERGEAVPVGVMAMELRARGYRVPATVSDYHEVAVGEPDEAVSIASTGRRTGYVWAERSRCTTLHWCRTTAPLQDATDYELLRAYMVVVREALEMGETEAGKVCVEFGVDREAVAREAVARVEAELQRREAAYAATEPSTP